MDSRKKQRATSKQILMKVEIKQKNGEMFDVNGFYIVPGFSFCLKKGFIASEEIHTSLSVVSLF